MDLHFKTNIQLKSIIGKDLINDDNIAILELVKNSFDADAKRVDISFFNLKENDDKFIDSYSEKTSRLIIKDDGLGMNLDDIKNKWLNIAYSEKKQNARQHNRMMAGAKGVGRFSCDRLGEFLNLYAKKYSENSYIQLKIDWKAFEVEDENREIQSVVLDYKELDTEDLVKRKIKPFTQGVILEIIKLRSKWVYEIKNDRGIIVDWNTEKLVNLKKYLEKLINPNQAFEKNDFGIYLNAPEFVTENNNKDEFQKFIGKIDNTIFERLDFKTTSIESEIIENGKIILSTLKDKGKIIFWIKEKNEFYPEIKNAKCYLYYLNPYSKAFFTKQTGVRPVEYGSIYLFLNGFRIPPYGEEGDDWLNLEQRRAQGYARFLSSRDIVGRIEILDSENSFQIISSREGLVRNESFSKLTNKDGYFYKSFKRLEKYVVDGLNWDSIPEEDKDKIREIERKIISGQLKENELIFREDEVIKRRRIYSSIHSIIGAKAGDVIELYINENLILDKIEEEKANAEREFEQLISDFEKKKIDVDSLNRILQRKAIENKDLEKQIADFSKYSTNEATAKAIAELQYYKDTIAKQTQIIEDLKLQLEHEKETNEKHLQELEKLQAEKLQAEKKAADEVKKRINAEKEKEEITKEKEKEIRLEKLKVEFYKKQSTPETDALIHHVKNNNLKIKENISLIINKLSEEMLGDSLKESIIVSLYEILHFANKSLKATDLILESDLDKADAQKINLPDFISGYSKNSKYKIKVHSINDVRIFYIIGSKLDLALMIDNFVDNSEKWGAKNIWFKTKLDGNSLILNVYDDGEGLSSKYKTNPNDIFKFRETAKKNGTGFGLYLVSESLSKMNAQIMIDKSEVGNGMNFKIIFR
ncbi:ATP-binding protein [uncultured Bacteroides sp.]|uniref:ATP-binding protein n=1 Tax=uncultured Bacteroides sp. TaxID=162156 RepID=UPI00262E579F|nr:ATP-binding protein [uncultured Bacteroides sp.]